MKHVTKHGKNFGPRIIQFTCPCGCEYRADPEDYSIKSIQEHLFAASTCPECGIGNIAPA